MTTFPNSKPNSSKTSNKRQQPYIANYLLPEVIEAITPLFLATVGALIGITVLVGSTCKDDQTECKTIDQATATAGFSLAGTAIAGGAGLARGGRSGQDFSVKQQDGNLKVDTPAER